MTFDSIDNLSQYLSESYTEKILFFVRTLSMESKENTYEIDGKNIYARVMSYQTKPSEECVIEAHRHHIDIQFSLQGAEGIDIFSRDQLRELKDYDAEQDAQLYEAMDDVPVASVVNKEGYFCLIPAGEPHRPMKTVADEGWVKKCVIKILDMETL